MARIIFGFAVCVLAYPLAILAMGEERSLGGALFVLPFTMFGTVFVGIPTFLFYKKRGWFGLWRYALGGGAVGILCSFFLAVAGVEAWISFALFFAAAGIGHAALFWIVGVWRNNALTRHSTGTPLRGTR